jgi:Zn-finger nucleic acid-binding protein
MKCPKCSSDFEQISFSDIEIDRCTNCKGLWFDLMEKEDLVRLEGSEIVDIGADQVDADYNAMRDVDCPRCNQAMIPMVDKDQFHIKFESCPSCYGTFFDAGEFRDLKEHTVLERFNQLLHTLGSNL